MMRRDFDIALATAAVARCRTLSTVVADRGAPPLSRSLRRSLYISNERFITRTVSIRSECA